MRSLILSVVFGLLLATGVALAVTYWLPPATEGTTGWNRDHWTRFDPGRDLTRKEAGR